MKTTRAHLLALAALVAGCGGGGGSSDGNPQDPGVVLPPTLAATGAFHNQFPPAALSGFRVLGSLAEYDAFNNPGPNKPVALRAARIFVEQGFQLAATSGTADHLEANGVPVVTRVAKVGEEGGGPAAVRPPDSAKAEPVDKSPRGRGARPDGAHIRRGGAGRIYKCGGERDHEGCERAAGHQLSS